MWTPARLKLYVMVAWQHMADHLIVEIVVTLGWSNRIRAVPSGHNRQERWKFMEMSSVTLLLHL